MNFLNSLLSELSESVTFLGNTQEIGLNWLGKLIRALIESIGIVGVGIIVFSLILRVIVLPFDVYQRIAMRKQNIKMKENQDKLEKLQKQYANDKAMYNQKMMEMYKANGISMFSSCLPAIISIVIFIVAINAFNTYSNYANLQNYNEMVHAYQSDILAHTAQIEESNFSVDGEKWKIESTDDNEYIFFEVLKPEAELSAWEDKKTYIENAGKEYFVNTTKYQALNGDAVTAYINGDENISVAEACSALIKESAQNNVKTVYDETISEKMSFLWIKNIWETDSSFKHPILDYSNFMSAIKRDFNGVASPYDEASYNIVTAKLSNEKGRANGYFVLIVLSIATIFLQQFISMRSQKEQSKYSTVDGQGAANNKMMLIIMTVMFAVFSFMYSSAFSIYMITSNVVSLIMTIVINKLVGVVMDKKEQKALQEKYNQRFPGRKYEVKENKRKK